jgi:hypothetical protein
MNWNGYIRRKKAAETGYNNTYPLELWLDSEVDLVSEFARGVKPGFGADRPSIVKWVRPGQTDRNNSRKKKKEKKKNQKRRNKQVMAR